MYDKFPVVPSGTPDECLPGWDAVTAHLRCHLSPDKKLVVECYPGVHLNELRHAFARAFPAATLVCAEQFLKPQHEIEEMLEPYLGDDPVFGRMNAIEIENFFAPLKLAAGRRSCSERHEGGTIVFGIGASLLCDEPDLLVYADLARWEIQMRQRRNEIGNFGSDNLQDRAALKYKRAFFVDWRAADRLKIALFSRIDLLLDTNVPGDPRAIEGAVLRRALSQAAHRPFRVVPFFDPGPWGGHWMERVCDLPTAGVPNYAWCFDCVPEENSLLLGFGDSHVEIPALDLVLTHPEELLGERVHARFGAEFPIRFDFLDTMDGGNLSLQVHPLTAYIREHFGMDYTQDESYYLLDAGEDACVYLGLKEGIDSAVVVRDLHRAQAGEFEFPVEKYVNRWPARKHDHFLIPAGTVHCSGRNSMVLEISATPYIFTFKLWDWGRLGLDGRPRPIHLLHGEANIQWDRTTGWVRSSLIDQVQPVRACDGWREERTGLHELEFIETRRHWFTAAVPHQTHGSVNVLNLVEGDEAVVESPGGAFDPFVVHYAETFIVPAAVGEYTIRPCGVSTGRECGTVLARIRV